MTDRPDVAMNAARRMLAERLLDSQHAITRELASAGSLDAAAPRIMHALRVAADADVACFWQLDETATRLSLRCFDARESGDDRAALTAFLNISRTVHFARGQGLPGRVWDSGSLESIEQITADRNFPRLPAAVAAGLRSAFAFPAAIGDQVFGVFEFFYSRRVAADPMVLEMLVAVGSEIGQFLERWRADAALRASEARKGAILESALDCIVTMNIDGMIEGVNAATERTFGYSREDMIGKPLADLIIPPQLRDAHWNGLARWRESGEGPILGRRIELAAMKADGAEFPVEVAIVPTILPDRVIFTGYLRDITERKRYEAELRRLTETLEQRVAERTAVAERRTHQLRLLSAELTTAEERERRRLAEFLHDHLQQLLVAARMRLGSVEARLTDASLSAAAHEVQDLLKEAIRESRSLTTELSPSILYEAGLAAGLNWLTRWLEQKHQLTVTADLHADAAPERQEQAVLLFQIARELLFNVVKHSGVKQATVKLHRSGEGDIQLEVSDLGRGIRLQPDTRRGFGLFSIRERLELIGGHMEVQAPPGGGTRIIVTLPAKPIAAALERSARDPVRVLLVDDQRAIREAMAVLIDDTPDLQVVAQASNGAEAVELARSVNPDVVLMDVNMPVLNGVDATRQIIAQSDPAQRPKVIGLSIHEERDMAHTMVAAGASEYLNKTVGAQELIWTIRRIARPESLRAGGDGETVEGGE